jgi:hypothetical protein
MSNLSNVMWLSYTWDPRWDLVGGQQVPHTNRAAKRGHLQGSHLLLGFKSAACIQGPSPLMFSPYFAGVPSSLQTIAFAGLYPMAWNLNIYLCPPEL